MAQTKQFPFQEAISLGWEITKKNFWLLLGCQVMVGILSNLSSFIPEQVIEEHSSLFIVMLILFVAGVFFSLLLSLGVIKIVLDLIDKKIPKFKDLFSLSNKVINLLLSSLVYSLIVLGGLILLIVPGIIWSLKFSLYKYFIVEKNAGPIEALKMSAQATDGAKSNLFLFGFVLAGVNLLGLLCLGIGLLFTIPLSWIAMAFVYRQLASQTVASPTPKAPKRAI